MKRACHCKCLHLLMSSHLLLFFLFHLQIICDFIGPAHMLQNVKKNPYLNYIYQVPIVLPIQCEKKCKKNFHTFLVNT